MRKLSYLYSFFIWSQLIGQCFGENEFISEQIEKFKSLEVKHRDLLKKMQSTAVGWEQMEQSDIDKLEKCILKMDIWVEMGKIKEKVKELKPAENYVKLNEISERLKNFHLAKDLMKFLKEKIENKQRVPKFENQKDPELSKVFADNFFKDIKTQIEHLGKKNHFEASSSQGDIASSSDTQSRGGHQKQVLPETNVNILEDLYDFRKTLNTEIKWLNMMLWLNKPRVYIEMIEKRLKDENEKKVAKFFTEFVQRQFMAPKKEEGNKAARKKYKQIEKAWNKNAESLQKKFNKNIKSKIPKGAELSGQGESSSTNEEDANNKQKYNALLNRMNFIILNKKMMKINLDGIKLMKTEEKGHIDNMLKEFVKKWNEAVENVRNGKNKFFEKFIYFQNTKLEKSYAEIFDCVALHRLTSMMLTLLFGIFEWDYEDRRMAAMWHLAQKSMEFIHRLAKNDESGQMSHLKRELIRKFKINTDLMDPMELTGNTLLMDEGEESIGSEDIRVQVVIDAFRMRTFYEQLNKLHKIKETNAFLNGNEEKKFEKEINDYVKSNLPEENLKNLANEYWKEYEENVNKALKFK